VPQSFTIDGQDDVHEPLGMSGVRLEVDVHIVTGAVSAVENVTKCIRRCGLDVRDVILQPLASATAVLSDDEKDLGVCLIDIGGGSVEVTLGTATHLTQGKSFKTGVIRLTERFIPTDPLSAHDERRLVKYLNREMGPYLEQIAQSGFDRVIGTSGTILSLGALALTEEE